MHWFRLGVLALLLANASFKARACAQGLLHSSSELPGPIHAIEDIDGDGIRELVVSSPTQTPYFVPLSDQVGVVEIRSGRTGESIRTWTSKHPHDGFGRGLDVLADLDEDGVDDIAIGSPFRGDDGVVEVFSTVSGEKIQSFAVDDECCAVGWSIFAINDVDQRGVQDYLVGSSGLVFDPGPTLESVHVVAGEDGARIRTHDVGWSLPVIPMDLMASLGDMNQDGVGDYAIADVENPGKGPFITVYSGIDGAEISIVTESSLSESGLSIIGSTMTGMSDMNSDGIPEWAISAPLCCGSDDDTGLSPTGAVLVIDGRSGRSLMKRTWSENERLLGLDLDSIPDQDGDGFEDLLTLSYETVGVNVPPGRIRILSSRDGHDVIAPFREYYAQDAEYLGDVNRDGFIDIGIREPYPNSSNNYHGLGWGIVLGGTRPNLSIPCGTPGTSLCTARLSAFSGGSLSLSTSIEVRGYSFRNQTTGLLFWSTARAFYPFHGGSLCVRPPYHRSPPRASGGSLLGADCSGAFLFEISLTDMILEGIGPGEPIYAQVWATDPGSATGSRLSWASELRYWR